MQPSSATPEPDNGPMNSPAFLKSPLETLLESIDDPEEEHVSLHDLIEAYNILSNRIRSQIRVILEADQFLPAFKPLKQHCNRVLQSLRRDICRALVDPSSNPRRLRSLENSLLSVNQVSENEIKYARDLSTLCHYALRFLSIIFSVPTLYSLFPTSDLGLLLDDLLVIAMAPSLPTPGPRKTFSLAIWTLQVQQLPLAVLSAKKGEILSALKRAIDGEVGKPEATGDSLKTIHNLLRHHSSQFLAPLVDLFPSTLVNLTSDDLDTRSQAARALSGFALAKMSTLSTARSLHDSMSSQIRTFIDTQFARRKSAKPESRLLEVLTEAIRLDNPSGLGQGPLWAVTVLSSLVLLSDSSLFSHSRSLKMFFPCLAQTLMHKCSSVRALLPHIWKCLIWAFSRISTERDGGGGGIDAVHDLRNRAFLVIKQELRADIGIALVVSLLGQTDTGNTFDNVSKALTVLKEMVHSNNQSTMLDGFSTFSKLVSAIGTSLPLQDTDWDQNVILARPVFDGTILLCEWKSLSTQVASMDQVRVDQARYLSEAEIICHWDLLMSIWVDVTERFLRGSSFIPSGDLFHTWQSLLLVQAQLTQGHGHLTTSSASAEKIASIVSGIFFPLETADAQLQQLSFVQKLWTVMRNVFTTSWLSSPAETILVAILKCNFILSHENVKVTWSQLCADLMSVGIPEPLDVIPAQNEHQGQLIIQRKLWTLCAKTWQAHEAGFTWKEVVAFLNVSFGAWHMSDYEIELWDGMLRNAISSAGSVSVQPITIIEHILQSLGEEKVKRLWSFPKEVATLLAHVDLSDQDTLPIELFQVIDDVLCALYPPMPELLSTSVQLLRVTGTIIASAAPFLLVRVLALLSKSLCCWIEDKSGVLLANEYDDLVIRLYCNPLDILQHQEPSLQMLHTLAPFFVSVFVHIPPLALGLDAFKTFWKTTYHGQERFCQSYPKVLVKCLKSIDDASIPDPAARPSSDTESQLTPSSIVPDSQPPRAHLMNPHHQGVDPPQC